MNHAVAVTFLPLLAAYSVCTEQWVGPSSTTEHEKEKRKTIKTIVQKASQKNVINYGSMCSIWGKEKDEAKIGMFFVLLCYVQTKRSNETKLTGPTEFSERRSPSGLRARYGLA